MFDVARDDELGHSYCPGCRGFRITSVSRRSPPRSYTTLNLSPGLRVETAMVNSEKSAIGSPAIEVTLSPDCKPASWAAVPAITLSSTHPSELNAALTPI